MWLAVRVMWLAESGDVVGVSGCLRVLVGAACVKCAFGVLRIFDT